MTFNLFIWLLGAVISNALMDVATIIWFSPCKPTVFGAVVATVNIPYLRVPKPYKGFNTYFSLLLSWGSATVTLLIIAVLIFLKKKKKNFGAGAIS